MRQLTGATIAVDPEAEIAGMESSLPEAELRFVGVPFPGSGP